MRVRNGTTAEECVTYGRCCDCPDRATPRKSFAHFFAPGENVAVMFLRKSIFLFLLILPACYEKAPADYCPLSPSARWQYDVTSVARGQSTSSRLVCLVEGDETVRGRDYLRLRNVSTGPGQTGKQEVVLYFRRTADGMLFLRKSEPQAPEQVYLPANLAVGQTWRSEVAGAVIDYQVAGYEDVTVGSRQYALCLKALVLERSCAGRANLVLNCLQRGAASNRQ